MSEKLTEKEIVFLKEFIKGLGLAGEELKKDKDKIKIVNLNTIIKKITKESE